jgi:3-methyladenine DNA glycosylase AlkD
MTLTQTMQALEAAGSAQTRKTYARHGIDVPMFGVSYAVLGKLTKKLKGDTALAQQLWATKNHDARVLASMIANPSEMTSKVLDTWCREVRNSTLSGALANLASESPSARTKMDAWRRRSKEHVASTGWTIVALLAMKGGALDDGACVGLIDEIERDIAKAPNHARYAMNNALIALGRRGGRLRDRAIAAARRIGKVEVDHGDTACKTPDAETYINKMRTRRGC